jgi:hypothetical protein
MRITKKGMLNEVKLLDTLDNLEPKVKRMLNLMYKRYVPKNDSNWRWWELSQDTIIKELMEDVGLSKRDAYKLTTFFIKHGQSLFNDYSYDVSDKELFSVDFSDNLNRYTEESKGNTRITLKKVDTYLDGEEVFYPVDEVWEGYKSIVLYLPWYGGKREGGTIYINYKFDNETDYNFILNSIEFKLKKTPDSNERVIRYLSFNLIKEEEIELPEESNTYESFVVWLEKLLNNVITEINGIDFKTENATISD